MSNDSWAIHAKGGYLGLLAKFEFLISLVHYFVENGPQIIFTLQRQVYITAILPPSQIYEYAKEQMVDPGISKAKLG